MHGCDDWAELERRESWPAQEGGDEEKGNECPGPSGTRTALRGNCRSFPVARVKDTRGHGLK